MTRSPCERSVKAAFSGFDRIPPATQQGNYGGHRGTKSPPKFSRKGILVSLTGGGWVKKKRKREVSCFAVGFAPREGSDLSPNKHQLAQALIVSRPPPNKVIMGGRSPPKPPREKPTQSEGAIHGNANPRECKSKGMQFPKRKPT